MFKKIWSNKPLIGLIIFSVIVAVINPRFLSTNNLLNVLRQTSINSVIAIIQRHWIPDWSTRGRRQSRSPKPKPGSRLSGIPG